MVIFTAGRVKHEQYKSEKMKFELTVFGRRWSIMSPKFALVGLISRVLAVR